MFQVISIFSFLLFSVGANAQWKRTDYNAKEIANASKNLISKLKKTNKRSKGDLVDDLERREEVLLESHLQLIEAYETTIFWANKSENQERFLKRLSLTLEAKQITRIKSALKNLKGLTHEFQVHDLIENLSTKYANSDFKEILSRSKNEVFPLTGSQRKIGSINLRSVKRHPNSFLRSISKTTLSQSK